MDIVRSPDPTTHPLAGIKRVRIVSGPNVSSSKITDAATGQELRCITDIRLEIVDRMWQATLSVWPMELDIVANVVKVNRTCSKCRASEELPLTIASEEADRDDAGGA